MKRKIIRILLFILGGLLGLLLLYKLYLNYRPEIELLLHFDHHNEQVLVNMVRSHGIEDLAFSLLAQRNLRCHPWFIKRDFLCT